MPHPSEYYQNFPKKCAHNYIFYGSGISPSYFSRPYELSLLFLPLISSHHFGDQLLPVTILKVQSLPISLLLYFHFQLDNFDFELGFFGLQIFLGPFFQVSYFHFKLGFNLRKFSFLDTCQ